jgi:hypothetical protein
MNIFTNNPISWSLVFFTLVFLAYAARSIKNEKSFYRKYGIQINFDGYEFLIPRWWSIQEHDKENISFERSDTRYDWKAKFTSIEIKQAQSLEELMASHLESQKIIFDNNELSISKRDIPIEGLHYEGTATQDDEVRIYYDVYLWKQKQKNIERVLLCESKSSILNGCVEGPYFEEVMQNIKSEKRLSSLD